MLVIWCSNRITFFIAQKKNIAIPSDIANLAVESAKNGFGSPLSLNNSSKLLDYQVMSTKKQGQYVHKKQGGLLAALKLLH